jgi:hypothetical protein
MDGAAMVIGGLAVAGTALGLFYLIGEHLVRKRLLREKAMRVGDGLPEFLESFRGDEIPEKRLSAVYRFFQTWVGDPGFPVRRTDSISDLYGIVEDDIERMIEKLTLLTGQEPPANWATRPLQTVGDVALLYASRKS